MMEEVLDRLRELAEDVPVPLDLPSDDDLLEVEENILLPIHPSLRLYLLEASDVVYGKLEPVTCADPNSHTYLAELTAVAWAEGLPRDFMVVCEVPSGYYAIDHEAGDIRFWERASCEFASDDEAYWSSLWDWISDVWLES